MYAYHACVARTEASPAACAAPACLPVLTPLFVPWPPLPPVEVRYNTFVQR